MTEKPDPSSASYFADLERYLKEQESEMLKADHKQYVVLREIMAKMRDKTPNDLIEKIREQETQKIPPAARNNELIEVAVEAKLASILAPTAKKILENGRIAFKQNPVTEYNDIARAKAFLRQQDEDLNEVIGARDTARFRCSTMNCLLDPSSLIFLNSAIQSYNSKIPQLAQLGIQLVFFPNMPMDERGRHEWVNQLLKGLILTNNEIQIQRQKITDAIRKLEHTGVIL